MCEKCGGTGEVALRAEAHAIVDCPFDPDVDHDPWPCGCCGGSARLRPLQAA